jgi:hypothetical protein
MRKKVESEKGRGMDREGRAIYCPVKRDERDEG